MENLKINKDKLPVPDFLKTLWKLVNDEEMDEVIYWNEDGKSFSIVTKEPWNKVLRLHYKHGNMSSFIRQLNLYGFKRTQVELDDDAEVPNKCEIASFYHQFFKKGHPSLLRNIRRNYPPKVAPPPPESTMANPSLTDEVLRKLEQLSTENKSIFELLSKMKKENLALWRELTLLRHSHDKQKDILSSLFHFILMFLRSSNTEPNFRPKRKLHLMIEEKKERGKRFRKRTGATTSTSSNSSVLSPSASTCDHANDKGPDSSQTIDSHAHPDVDDSHYGPLIMNIDTDQSVINNDVMLTSGNQDVDSKHDLNFDNFMSILTPQNSVPDNTDNNNMNETGNHDEMSLITCGPKNVTIQDKDIELLNELLKDKKCNMDPNSFLEMFNHNYNLPFDSDYLNAMITEEDQNGDGRSLIPYTSSSSYIDFEEDINNFLNSCSLDNEINVKPPPTKSENDENL